MKKPQEYYGWESWSIKEILTERFRLPEEEKDVGQSCGRPVHRLCRESETQMTDSTMIWRHPWWLDRHRWGSGRGHYGGESYQGQCGIWRARHPID